MNTFTKFLGFEKRKGKKYLPMTVLTNLLKEQPRSEMVNHYVQFNKTNMTLLKWFGS